MPKKPKGVDSVVTHVRFEYESSIDEKYQIVLPIQNNLDSLMEVLRDFGYEDWGECRGRAWCRTCHVSIGGGSDEGDSQPINDAYPMTVEEAEALDRLHSRTKTSRLACQINITGDLQDRVIGYQGD